MKTRTRIRKPRKFGAKVDGGLIKNNNKDLRLTKRGKHLLEKYGISEAQYEDLYRKQAGCCAVCQQPSSAFKYKLAIDHDHVSGEIRGLLCYRCNKFAIGRHRKQSSLGLIKAILQYLDRDYTGWFVPPKTRRKKQRRLK